MSSVTSNKTQLKHKWNQLLTESEMRVAEDVVRRLSKDNFIMFEKSVEQVYEMARTKKGKKFDVLDNGIDPYKGIKSNEGNFQIWTDGKVKYNNTSQVGETTVTDYEVSGYSYIVLWQHFPHQSPSKDVKYQAIITKKFGMKLYMQHLLKMTLG